MMLLPAMAALQACGARPGEPAATETAEAPDRLVLSVSSAQTATDGRRCVLDVMARNDTGRAALNVQVAWMAQTRGYGSISDYQVLGDFAAGEQRALQLAVHGAPCDAVQALKLSRAVCTVGPVEGTPESCADRVALDLRGFPASMPPSGGP